jgi:hypothetical protein
VSFCARWRTVVTDVATVLGIQLSSVFCPSVDAVVQAPHGKRLRGYATPRHLQDVYLTIAGAFGVSSALEKTFVAKNFAELFIKIGRGVGGTGAALIAIYIATALMSELLTNNAAGAIMYPIAAIAGDVLDIKARDTSVAIMLGASAGFANPFR